jgi:hypothetical protein
MHNPSAHPQASEVGRLAERVPSIWVSRWESALASGNYELAAECARRLEHLGVRVRLAWTGRVADTSEGDADAR